MNTPEVPADGDIGRKFIQLAANVEAVCIGSRVRNECSAVWTRHNRVRNDGRFVKQRFQHRDTRASDSGMARSIGRMQWRAFGKSLWQQIGAVFTEDLGDRG